MSKNLTTSGNYNINTGTDDVNITAANVAVTGNLIVTGTTTTITTTNLAITDNVIVLNKDEAGAGVTAGTAGVEIERGSVDNASLIWDEATDKFIFKLGSGIAGLQSNATTVSSLTMGAVTISAFLDEDNFASDSATGLATQQSIKAYIGTQVGGAAGGANTQVQYNSSGGFGGSSNFTFASGTGAITISGFLDIDNIRIDANTISAQNTNGDVVVTANGTGQITLSNKTAVSVELDFTDQGSDPSATATKNKIYSKAPSGGGTGLYFVNNTTSGEMISKSKAIAFSLVFGG